MVYSVRITFNSNNDSSNFPGKRINSTHDSSVFPGIDSIEPITQVASKNIGLNHFMTQAETIRFTSSHESTLGRPQVCCT